MGGNRGNIATTDLKSTITLLKNLNWARLLDNCFEQHEPKKLLYVSESAATTDIPGESMRELNSCSNSSTNKTVCKFTVLSFTEKNSL